MILMALMFALAYLVFGYTVLCVSCLIDERWMEINARGQCVFTALWPIFVLCVLDIAIRRFVNSLPFWIVEFGEWWMNHLIHEGDWFTDFCLNGPRRRRK